MKKLLLFFLIFVFTAVAQNGIWTKPVGIMVSIFETPGSALTSKVICQVNDNDSVLVTGIHYEGKFYEVSHNGRSGYIRTFELVENNQMKQMKEQFIAGLKVRVEELQKEKEKILTKTFGKSTAKKIINQEIWIGMTTEMCLQSWGEPGNKTRTVSANGTSEYWYYGSNVLFFLNDKLYSFTEM